MALKDAFRVRDKIGTLLFQSLVMEDTDVEIDPRTSLEKDSERLLFKAKNLKEDLRTVPNADHNLKIKRIDLFCFFHKSLI
jgi:hypothetical protein